MQSKWLLLGNITKLFAWEFADDTLQYLFWSYNSPLKIKLLFGFQEN